MTERRRTAAKAKRVQQVKRQIFLLAVAAMVIVGVGIYFVKINHHAKAAASLAITESIKSQNETDAIEIDKVVEEVMRKTETPEERLKRVERDAIQAGYPEKVIELLSKNVETVQFVEEYEEKKNIEPVKYIEGLKKGEIPQLLQWDERWGYSPYGTGIVATCGCGPTCLSMVFSGLTGDASLTPAKLAQYGMEHNYINKENDTKWSFMTEACKEWGISCREELLEEKELKNELKAGNPIICSVGPGVFTKIGHFIVLAGFEDGKVIVHDPFSQINSDKRWKYDDFKDQIKNMWIYSKK